MPISDYLKQIREKVGNELLLLTTVAAIVLDENGDALVVRHVGSNRWALPGGIVDPGEQPAQAVVREVYEETGILARPERIAGVFGGSEKFRRTYPNGHQVEYHDIVFICRKMGGTLGCLDGEVEEARFRPLSEIPAWPEFGHPIGVAQLVNGGPEAAFNWKDEWLPAAE